LTLGSWFSQRGRVGWRSCRSDLARGGQQLEVGFAVVALGSRSRRSDLVSLLIFWLFRVCDFCGFTVVVSGVFGLPWLWLGLSWVVGSCWVVGLGNRGCGWVCRGLWVAVVDCGFAMERVFVGFLIYCVHPFVLIVC
jgi:hypothetical protein